MLAHWHAVPIYPLMAFARAAFWKNEMRDERALVRDFWIKLRGIGARLPFLEDLLAAYYCAFDRDTPFHVKASLVGAIAYFVLPFDAVPDFLPILGFGDDAAVLAGTIKLVAGHIKPVHRDAARAKLDEIQAAV